EEKPIEVEEPEEEPVLQTITPTKCEDDSNPYYRNYQWALQDCLCRPFQNEYFMKNDNTERIKDGNTPFVPVTEELCKNFIPLECSAGFPVEALFPIPAPCGCNRKPGSIATERFNSLCHLLKFSAENRKRKIYILGKFMSYTDIIYIFIAFLSYSYCWPF
ncbi:hypothetical protein KR059_007033, partial [Drosophila kikkawai]